MGQSGAEVFDDFGGDDAGGWEVGAVFEGVVFEPEDVEVHFVALDQLVVGEAFELFRLFAGVAGGRARTPFRAA